MRKWLTSMGTYGKQMTVWFVILCFSLSLVAPQAAYAQQALIPQPGTRVQTSPVFTPPIITGLQLSEDDPLQINFLIDTGDNRAEGEQLSQISQKLIHYFFAALTVPENEMWVNLSPYEKNKIIAEPLSHTAMGRDMLAQDYLLKQLSASMLYPEDELGQSFWQRVQRKALEQFGTTDVPMNTFNKIWIVPERAQIYVNGPNVFIADSHLKVMLEEDYLALQHHAALEAGKRQGDIVSGVSDEVVREVLIPEIEREINAGQNFAPLRQIFHSLILATWYKKNLRDSILGQVYVDRNKVDGIEIPEENIKEEIYQQYLTALQKGVFDYIREDEDPSTGEPIPRRYFSGGVDLAQLSAESLTEGMTEKLRAAAVTRTFHTVETYAGLQPTSREIGAVASLDEALDRAMLSDAPERLEAQPGQFRLVPEREENERNTERRAAIEIRQRLGLLYGETEAIMALRRNALTEAETIAIEQREQQLLLDMRQLYNEMPLKIVIGQDYDFYSQALQDLKSDRRRVSALMRRADVAGDKDKLARLNLQAIRINRLLIKTQLMVAGLLLTGKSRDGIRHPTPAMNALEGAINSASALEIELEYRIQRLRGRKFRRVIETQDWVGNRVRTFRLGTFDINVDKPAAGEKGPRVTVRQRRPVNVHTRLDRARRLANKGEIAAAVKQINSLIGIYRLRYFKTLETYRDIEADLRALRDIIAALPEGEALPKGDLKEDIKARVVALTANIQSPKLMVWDDVRYRSRRKAFEGSLRKIASELAEYMVILKNKTDLDYYAKKLVRAQQRKERARAVTLSQRDRVMIIEKLAELQKWTQRGFVESKVTAAIDFAPVIELINQDDFKRAEMHLQRIIGRLDKRIADIESITTNLKDSAASLFADFRRSDIISRTEEIIEAVNEEEFGPALDLLDDMEDEYFEFDHPEPGLVRVARQIKEARHILSDLRPESVAEQGTTDALYDILWRIKEDTKHATQFRVNVLNEKGQRKAYFPQPGITVQGLLNVGQRDSQRTTVLLNGQVVPRQEYARTRIADDSRVELRRDEAMIAIDSHRLNAALGNARIYAEKFNEVNQPDEPLKIRVQLNHETLVRWDTSGSQEGLIQFVNGKLARANPTNQPGEVSIRTEANHVFISWKPDGGPHLLGPDDGLGGDAAMLSAPDRIRLLYGIKNIHDTLTQAETTSAAALVEDGAFLNADGVRVDARALRLWSLGRETIDAKQIHLTRSVLEYLAEQLGLATLYRISSTPIQPRAEAPYLWLIGSQVISDMYLELPQPGDGERDIEELADKARQLTETLLATISVSLPRELLGRTAADNAVFAQPDAALLAEDDDMEAWLEQRGVPEPRTFIDNMAWLHQMNDPQLRLSEASLTILRDVILSNLIYGHPLDVLAVEKVGLAMAQYRKLIDLEPRADFIGEVQPLVVDKAKASLENRIRYLILNNDQRRLAKALLHFDGTNISEVIDILTADPYDYHTEISREEMGTFYRMLTPLLQALPVLSYMDRWPDSAEGRALRSSRIGRFVEQMYSRREQNADLLLRYIVDEFSALRLILQGDNLAHISRYTEDAALLASADDSNLFDLSRLQPPAVTGAENVLVSIRRHFPEHPALNGRSAIADRLQTWASDPDTRFSGNIVRVVAAEGETAALGYLDENVARLFDLPYIDSDASMLVDSVSSIAQHLDVPQSVVADAMGEALSVTQALVRWDVLANDLDVPEGVRNEIYRALEEGLEQHARPYDAAALTRLIFETEAAYKSLLPTSSRRDVVVTLNGAPGAEAIDYPLGLLRSLFYILGSSVDWRYFGELIEAETGLDRDTVRERLDEMAFRFIYAPYIMEYVTVNGMVIATKMRFPTFADFVNYQRGSRPDGRLINRGTPLEIVTHDDPRHPIKTVFDRLDDEASPTALLTGAGYFDGRIIKEITYTDYSLGRDMAIFGKDKDKAKDTKRKGVWRRRILLVSALILVGGVAVTWLNVKQQQGDFDPVYTPREAVTQFYEETLAPHIADASSQLAFGGNISGRLLHELHLQRTEIQAVLETETRTPGEESETLRAYLDGKVRELDNLIARAEGNVATERNASEFEQTVDGIQYRYNSIRFVVSGKAPQTATEAIDRYLIEARTLRQRLTEAQPDMDGIAPLIERMDTLITNATELQARLANQTEDDNGMLASLRYTPEVLTAWLQDLLLQGSGSDGEISGIEQMAGRLLQQIARTQDLDDPDVPLNLRRQLAGLRDAAVLVESTVSTDSDALQAIHSETDQAMLNRRDILRLGVGVTGLIFTGFFLNWMWGDPERRGEEVLEKFETDFMRRLSDLTDSISGYGIRGETVPQTVLQELRALHDGTKATLEVLEWNNQRPGSAQLREFLNSQLTELDHWSSVAGANQRTPSNWMEVDAIFRTVNRRFLELQRIGRSAPRTVTNAIEDVIISYLELENHLHGLIPTQILSNGDPYAVLLSQIQAMSSGALRYKEAFDVVSGFRQAQSPDLFGRRVADAAVLGEGRIGPDMAAFAEMTVPVTEVGTRLDKPIELRIQIVEGEVQVDTGNNTEYADYAAVLIDEMEYHLSRPETDPAVLENISDLRFIITTDTTEQFRDSIVNKLPLAANGNPLIAHSSVSKKAVTVHPYFFSRQSGQLRRLLFTHEVISRIGKQSADQETAIKHTHDYLREEFAAAELDIPELLRINRELSQPEKVFLADIRRQRNYRSGLNDIPDSEASAAIKDAVLAATQFLELFAASTDKFNFNGIAARAELAENPEIVIAFGKYLEGQLTAEQVTELIDDTGAAWAGTVFANALRHVKASNIFSVLRKDYDPVTLVIDAQAITADKRVVDYVFSYRPGYFYALTQIVDRNNGTGSLAQGGIRFKPLQRRGADGKLLPESQVAYDHFQSAFAEVDMISRSKFDRNTVTQTPYSGAKTIMTVFPDSKNIKTVLLKSLARSYVDAGVTARYVIGTESGMTGRDQDTLAQAIGTRYRDHLKHELEEMKKIPSVGQDLSTVKSTSLYGKHLRTIEEDNPDGGRFLRDPLMDALRQRVVASIPLGQQNGGTSLVKLFNSRLEADIARTIGAAATGRFTDKELTALKEWSLTAFSAAMSIEAIDEYMPDRDLRNRKIGVRGATAGGSLALMLTRMGYQVVAIEDINGTVYKKDGFTVAELQRLDNIALNERNVLRWMPEETGVVQHLPKGSLGDKDRMDLDILISAAPGHHLDQESVDRMRGMDDEPGRDPLIYVEAGFNSINGFEKELHRKGILAFKSTSIGFGGAYGSYLEDYIKHRFTTEQLRRIVLRSGDTDIVTAPEIVVNDRFTVTNATGTDTVGEIVLENGSVVSSTIDNLSVGMNLDMLDGQLYSQGIRLPYKYRQAVKTLIWDNYRVEIDGQDRIRKSNHPDLPRDGRAIIIDPVQEIRITAYQDIKGIAKRMNTMVMELARHGGTPGGREFRMTPTQAIKRITKLISDKKRQFDTSTDEGITEAIQTIIDRLESDGFFLPANVARKIAVKRLVASSDLSIQLGDDTYYFNAEGRLVQSPETDSEDVPGHVRMKEALSGSFDFSLKSARQAETSLRAQESRALEAQHLIGLDKRLRVRTEKESNAASSGGGSIEEQVLAAADTTKKKTRPEAVRYLESQRAQKVNRAGLDTVLPDVAPRRRDILLGAATLLEMLSHYEVKHNRGEHFDAVAAIEELVAHPDIAEAMIDYVYKQEGAEERISSLLTAAETQWLNTLFERGIRTITATSADIVQPDKNIDTSGGNREAIAIRFNGVSLTGVENKKELVFIYLPGRFYAMTQLVDLSTAEHTKGGIRYAQPIARSNDPQKRNIDEVAHDIMKGAYEDLNNLSVSQYSKNVLAGIGYAGAKTYFGVHQDATALKDELLQSWARAMVDVGLMEVYDGGPDVGMSSDNQETIIEGIVRRYTMHLMNEVRTMHAHGVDLFDLNLSTYGKALAEIERETGQRFLDDSLIGYMRKRLLLQLPKGKENGSVILERVFNRKLKDEIVKIIGSAVTGGSAKVGAISHVELAVTGDSTWHSIEAILEYKGLDPKVLRTAVVGAGDVGGSIALKMARQGLKVVAISDVNGAVHKPAGFTIEELQNLNNIDTQSRNVLEWMPEQPGVEHLHRDDIVDSQKIDIDLLVPAAMGGLIQTTKSTDRMVEMALKEANITDAVVDDNFVRILDTFRTRYNDEYITEHLKRHMGGTPSTPEERQKDFESYIEYQLQQNPGKLENHPRRKNFIKALAKIWMNRKGNIEMLRTADDDPDRTPLIIIEGSNNAFVGVEEELKKRGILAVSGMSVNFGGVKGSTKEAMLKHLLTVKELRTITLRDADGKVIPTAINTDVTERIRVEADGIGTELGTVIVHNGRVVSSDIDEITIGSNLDPLDGRLFNRGDDLGYTIGSLERRLAWDNYVVVQQGYETVTASNHPDIVVGSSYEYLDPLDTIKQELYEEIEQIARRNNIMVMELSEKYDMTPTEAVVRLARALGQRKADIYAATEGEDMTKREAIVARYKKEKYFMAPHIMRNIAAIQVATESELSVAVGDEMVTFDAKGFITDQAIMTSPDTDVVLDINPELRNEVLTLIEAKMIEQGADVGMQDWITPENILEATRLYQRDRDFSVRVRYNPIGAVEISPMKEDQAITAEEARALLEAEVANLPVDPLQISITEADILTTIRANGRVRVTLDIPDPIAGDLKWDELAATGIIVTPLDQAMTAEEPGGIDFDTRNMDLQVGGGEFIFNGPAADVKSLSPAHIQGLQPVIINITPLPNLMPLLGLQDSGEDGLRSVQQTPRPVPVSRPRLSKGEAPADDPRKQLIQTLAGVL